MASRAEELGRADALSTFRVRDDERLAWISSDGKLIVETPGAIELTAAEVTGFRDWLYYWFSEDAE